jgi:hypothetical protein
MPGRVVGYELTNFGEEDLELWDIGRNRYFVDFKLSKELTNSATRILWNSRTASTMKPGILPRQRKKGLHQHSWHWILLRMTGRNLQEPNIDYQQK